MKRTDMRVYAVTDRHWLNGETLYSQVEKALEGGATFIQLREKKLDEESFLKEAIEIQKLCKKHHVPFVINDNVDIALKINADGVHVGQSDMEAGDVRAKLGKDKIIGVSAHTVEEALTAQKKGADYLGVGAVFPTSSKDDVSVLSLETLKAICHAVSIPVVAIGGISQDNIDKLYGSGIDGVAVISAIFGQKDIKKATRELVCKTKKTIKEMRTDMINGAIFDMDGVLIDSMPIWHNAGALFLEANGKKPRSDLQKILFDKSMMAGAEYMRDAYDLPMTMEEVMQGVIDVVYKHYKESIPAKANVENFLRKLKEKDIAIALATSSDRKLLEAGLSRLHLLSYFDTTVTCLEAGVGKIEPDVYLEAMKRIGTTLENTWVFEDAYHALHTAKKAGFHTVALYDASNDEHQELLKKEADIYLKDLTDFDTFYQFATRES